ncbi:hypothetical protein VCHA53O466_50467 [Vibrio chagasii]|nr:hypothetical protein VCHA53O466_50467 [Vibrio chagasii]
MTKNISLTNKEAIVRFKSYSGMNAFFDKFQKKLNVPKSELMLTELTSSARNYNTTDIFSTLNFVVLTSEKMWQENGKNIIFLEDQDTVNSLLNLKFTAKISTGLTMDFSSFMLSVPTGAKFNGKPIPPCLISIEDFDIWKSSAESVLTDDLGMAPKLNFKTEGRESNVMRVIIPDHSTPQAAYKSVCVPLSKLPLIVNTPLEKMNKELYLELIGQYSAASLELDSEDEIVEQMVILRLVVAMAIYNRLTNNEFFRTGVPTNALSPKYMGLSKDVGKAATKYVFSKPHQALKGTKGAHVRSAHIRQYTDEKYYQGEYSKLAIGERFTLVSEALVGEGEPHTQSAK